jgi:nucleotide-binding universal stress UspA family protein
MAGETLMRPIVVGVDGSSTSTNALAWAADEAAIRRYPLRVVCADLGGPETGAASDSRREGGAPTENQLSGTASDIAVVAAKEACDRHPDLRAQAVAVPGRPVQVLLQESKHASLLVMGSRALSPVRDIALGAVSRPIVQQSTCPIVVVRERVSRSLGDLRVIVGVDRSSSDDALSFAFEEARLWQSALTAVHACQPTPPVSAHRTRTVQRRQREDEERQWLDEMLRPWRQSYPDVEVVRDVAEDEPAPRLVRLSENARLLVVGSRGRGPVSALALGSVSMAAVQQARCPVAVVRRGSAEDGVGRSRSRERTSTASAPPRRR